MLKLFFFFIFFPIYSTSFANTSEFDSIMVRFKRLNDSQIREKISLLNQAHIDALDNKNYDLVKNITPKLVDFQIQNGYLTESYSILLGLLNNQNIIKDVKFQTEILFKLGKCCFLMRDFEQAKQFQDKCTQICQFQNDTNCLSKSFLAIGIIYGEQSLNDSALFYLNKAEILASNDEMLLSMIYSSKGNVLFKLNQLQEAIKFYDKSILLKDKLNDKKGKIVALLGLSKINMAIDKPIPSLRNAFEAHTIASKESMLKEKVSALSVIYENYKKMNDLKSALQYGDSLRIWKDTLTYRSKNEQIAKIQAENEYHKTIAENKYLRENELKLAAEDKIKNTQIKLISLLTFGFLLIAVILIYYSTSVKKKNNKLEIAHRQIFEVNQLLKNQNETLEKLHRHNKALYSIIAHDLKGPMASLTSLTDLMQMNIVTQQEFNDLLEKIKPELNNNRIMIENLLYWGKSQLDGLKVEIKEIKIEPIITSIFEQIQLNHKQKQLKLNLLVAQDKIINCDEGIFKIIVTNLINNAIKYALPNSEIKIFEETTTSYTQVFFENESEPINENLKNELFEIYKSTANHISKGTGLGLPLTNLFAKEIGAEIKLIKSDLNSTLFCINISN